VGDETASGEQLAERYETLRAAALGAAADGFRHGLGLLLGKGVAAWIAVAAHAVPEPADRDPVTSPASAALAGSERELVGVLAGIALACVDG
jgi:hypothetical protein